MSQSYFLSATDAIVKDTCRWIEKEMIPAGQFCVKRSIRGGPELIRFLQEKKVRNAEEICDFDLGISFLIAHFFNLTS